jgi:MFS transporter, LPLT family, lysophospholipid transporter
VNFASVLNARLANLRWRCCPREHARERTVDSDLSGFKAQPQSQHDLVCFTPHIPNRNEAAAHMKKGFYTIMAAQFCSSLADNALLVAAIEMLKTTNSPPWQIPALGPMFALFYVILAPFLGAFADAVPKGRVMFLSNGIKVLGCGLMLFGGHPLLAYGVVGLGAAAYSPAKYGILTELLPNSQLVKANGWIEGLTIMSILLGIGLGGQLIGPAVAGQLLSIDLPIVTTSVDTPPESAIAVIVFLYGLAAAFNLRIPRTDAPLQPLAHGVWALVRDFFSCNRRLWRDKLGQISLATTTLFWGVSGNLRIIVFAWAAVALGYTTTQATTLVAVVVVGTAAGAIVASLKMRLDMATRVISLGIALGLLVVGLNFITNVWVAAPFLVVLGAIGGFMVVPMNALLQHRGANLMGAGRSIAVQNFNEQACILGLGAFYTGMTRFGLSAFSAIAVFGLVVAGTMWGVYRWHQSNCVRHRDELEHLLAIARSDTH